MNKIKIPIHIIVLFIAAVWLLVPLQASAWNLAIRTQVVRDAIMLSPPAIRNLFAEGADAIPSAMVSVPNLTKRGKRDPGEHFNTTLKIISGSKKNSKRMVREMIALSSYTTQAVKPKVDLSVMKEISVSKSLFVVEFDGYHQIDNFKQVLVDTCAWSQELKQTVEQYAASNNNGLRPQATESLAVLYNIAVNQTVDAWVTLFSLAGTSTQSDVVTGSIISPKSTQFIRSRFQLSWRVNFSSRMSGFLENVYGISEVGEDDIITLEGDEILGDVIEVSSDDEGEVVNLDNLLLTGDAPVTANDNNAPPGMAVSSTAMPVKTNPVSEPKPVAVAEPKKETTPQPVVENKPPKTVVTKTTPKVVAAKSTPPPEPVVAVEGPGDDDVFEITDDTVISEKEVSAIQVDENKITPAAVKMDRDSRLDTELAKAFSSLDFNFGSSASVEQAKLNGGSVDSAEIATDFNDACIESEHKVVMDDKEASEVSMVFVIPDAESGNTGVLDSKKIGRVIGMNIGGIKYCYEKELRENPGLSGKIVVEFVIAEDGNVESAHAIKSTIRSHEVEECILEKMSRLKFPPPVGGKVTVSYPFVFEKSYSF